MAEPVRTHAREDARSRPWPALSQAWRRRALPYRRPRKLVGRTREDEDIAMTRPPRQLLEWQPPRAGRPRRRSSSLLAGVVGLVLLGASVALDFAVNPAPRLGWNHSRRAPTELWRHHTGPRILLGAHMLGRTPASPR